MATLPRVIARVRLPALGEETFHFGAGRHGGLRAAASDGDGCGGGGEARRGPWVVAFEQRHGKCAVEAVAGGYCIDGLNRKMV